MKLTREQEWQLYVEEERMTTTAEWLLMLWRTKEVLKTATSPQQRRYLNAQIASLERTIRLKKQGKL